MEATKIIFKNGVTITVEQNGNCFITTDVPEFPEDMSEVTVERAGNTNIFHNAEVMECASIDGRYWFTFIETPRAELALKKMQQNIHVIADITGVDLDVSEQAGEITLTERINDLEIAICELVDAIT